MIIKDKNFEMYCGDCLEVMPSIPDGSIDMVLTDPPYGTMKGCTDLRAHGYKWDVKIPQETLKSELPRMLRPNGASLLFCQEPYTSVLTKDYAPSLPFAYRLTWLKNTFGNPLSAKKAPLNYTEDIVASFKISPKRDENLENPVRGYAKSMFVFLALTKAEINTRMGCYGVDHFFRFDSPQFSVPTPEKYDKLLQTFDLEGFQVRPHSEIKKQYEEFKQTQLNKLTEENPRVFNLQGASHIPNVLKFDKATHTIHPTQKPVPLLEYLIKTYTREGDTVLDFTMGSGSTGVACANTNRKFIGIERDVDFYAKAAARVMEAYA